MTTADLFELIVTAMANMTQKTLPNAAEGITFFNNCMLELNHKLKTKHQPALVKAVESAFAHMQEKLPEEGAKNGKHIIVRDGWKSDEGC